jgi:hypothetical protein
MPASTVSGATVGANVTQVYQFVCCSPGVNIAVRTIRIVLSAAPASSTGIAGIYADSSGAPGSLLVATNTAATSATGAVEFAFASPQTLSAGTTYWIAISSDTTGLGITKVASATAGTLLNETSHPRAAQCGNASTGSGVSLALAATCGTVTGAGKDPIAVIFLP